MGAVLSVTCLWLGRLSLSVKFLRCHIHPDGQERDFSIVVSSHSRQGGRCQGDSRAVTE